jgi:hypothetical protein
MSRSIGGAPYDDEIIVVESCYDDEVMVVALPIATA